MKKKKSPPIILLTYSLFLQVSYYLYMHIYNNIKFYPLKCWPPELSRSHGHLFWLYYPSLECSFVLNPSPIDIHQCRVLPKTQWILRCFSFLKCQPLSYVQLFVTPWTVAHQAPLSTGFFKKEYWSGLPFPSPGISPTLESNLCLLVSCIGRWVLYHQRHLGSPF